MKHYKTMMPQEIEVWYLMPALRKEIALFLVDDFKFSQKDVAGIFGITEAAVSQYINSKRANEIKFSKAELAEIKKTAEKISKEKKNFMKHIYNLSVNFRRSEVLCRLHRRKDKSVSNNCKICKEK